MTKIIGYARVSTTKQDLSRQKLKIKEFCENNNYELIEIIEDFGISGVVADRRGYLELQSRTYKDADMIVISELSRLSRQEDVTETVHNIQQIINKGLSVILLGKPDDRVFETGALFRNYGFVHKSRRRNDDDVGRKAQNGVINLPCAAT